MRHPQASWTVSRQGMIGDSGALEYAEALIAERTPDNTVDVEESRVRSQTGPDR